MLSAIHFQGSLSKALGFLSLGIFVISQVPQIVKSQRTKKADDLSIDFLCLWLVGDMCGLIGDPPHLFLLHGSNWHACSVRIVACFPSGDLFNAILFIAFRAMDFLSFVMLQVVLR